MDLPIFPVCYFPPAAYFTKLKLFNELRFEVCETFPKQTIRNRCYILSANGVLMLSVPLESRKNHDTTSDIKISYRNNWKLIHRRAIETAYKKSPFFEFYCDVIFAELEKPHEYLTGLNIGLTSLLATLLKTNLRYSFTEKYSPEKNSETDFRKLFSYKTFEKRTHDIANGKAYQQVFVEKFGFVSGLSVLDLLFNLGPQAETYISNLSNT
jgi:hypothetical protein